MALNVTITCDMARCDSSRLRFSNGYPGDAYITDQRWTVIRTETQGEALLVYTRANETIEEGVLFFCPDHPVGEEPGVYENEKPSDPEDITAEEL